MGLAAELNLALNRCHSHLADKIAPGVTNLYLLKTKLMRIT